ncbi:MAG: hydantoinase B/oxoprolinase family protein [Bryobacterales bacterium]|nr:hydantoinase B/oxoprolinase family protein [Bryobacterales bacterium]MBV9400798.1 hydantoinase B/oxoprolinase family protein [Bryobacterales bacterium]
MTSAAGFRPRRASVRHQAIELELFRHLLVSIAEEMGVVLRRTSYSANIKERRDYSCAVYDARGDTVAMGDHMPVHLGAMPLSVRAAREAFELEPGDIALLNDPFRGGTHLPDITAVAPVYTRGSRKPSFFLANRAHHADVGGMSPGSMPLAREIYQEGIRIPPIKIQRRGKLDRDLLNLLLANVRTPVEREGDLMAQLAAIQRGATRLNELVAKYGAARVASNMGALQDYSERMMRAAIRALPPGVYRFEDCLDNDGISPDPVPVRVAIAIARGSAIVDFSGSAPQAAGAVNANYAVTLAAVMYVFRCLMKEDVPFTAGTLRPIRVIAPEGTVINARPPAAMAAGNVETSQRVTDVVLGALAQAVPELMPAASSGTMNNLSFGGWDPFRNSAFAYYETIAGGMGASSNGDGDSATHTHMTNTLNTPVEAFEHQFPVRVESYRVRRGSGGAGRHRGGDGIVRELRFLTEADVTILSDRRIHGPWGLSGGSAGKPGKNTLIRNSREIRLEGKTRVAARPGDTLRIETPGGGGWGSYHPSR